MAQCAGNIVAKSEYQDKIKVFALPMSFSIITKESQLPRFSSGNFVALDRSVQVARQTECDCCGGWFSFFLEIKIEHMHVVSEQAYVEQGDPV